VRYSVNDKYDSAKNFIAFTVMIDNNNSTYVSSFSYPTDSKRNFFVNHNYGGCPSDYGWFMMKDYDALSGCSEWDAVTGKSYFLYAGGTTMVNWATGTNNFVTRLHKN
jgi:hypothetical protein